MSTTAPFITPNSPWFGQVPRTQRPLQPLLQLQRQQQALWETYPRRVRQLRWRNSAAPSQRIARCSSTRAGVHYTTREYGKGGTGQSLQYRLNNSCNCCGTRASPIFAWHFNWRATQIDCGDFCCFRLKSGLVTFELLYACLLGMSCCRHPHLASLRSGSRLMSTCHLPHVHKLHTYSSAHLAQLQLHLLVS